MPKPKLGYLRHVDPEIFMDLFDLVSINEINDVYLPNASCVDAVLFGVGTDINPTLYGQHAGSYTQQPDNDRDRFEKTMFKMCENLNIPMIGICRGAQLITAMTGGSLVQHISGHAGSRHDIETVDGRTINVNSYHHQMCVPRFSERRYNAQIIGHTITPRSRRYLGQEDVDLANQYEWLHLEPEVIVFGKIPGSTRPNCLAIQGHPEWETPGSPFWNYTLELTEKYIINKARVDNVYPEPA